MPTLEDAIRSVATALDAHKAGAFEGSLDQPHLTDALAHALALLDGLRWRPIEEAPDEGYFMAWNDAWDEPMKVHKWKGHGRWNVCHGYTGKLWQATHYRPLPTPPEGRGDD